MKSKRMLLVLVFVVILAIGWLTTIKTVTGSEEIKKQDKLIEDADLYMERALYVRAIDCYEEALTYSTRRTLEVEEKLLEAYLVYGDMASYAQLVEKRIAEGIASEKEYIHVADYEIARSRLEDAMVLVRKGMEQMDSDVLEEYYEEHRYDYSMINTEYMNVLPTETNEVMPAFDGEKWGYVNQTGRVKLQFIYDKVLPFNSDGYAVVLVDGTYYTILGNGDRYGADDGSYYSKMTDVSAVSGTHILGKRDGTYSYYDYDFEPVAAGHQYIQMTSNACGVAAVKGDSGWGIITDSGDLVVDFILEDVAVNSLNCVFANDRAMVKEDGWWHMIDTEGNPVGDSRYVNAKAPESGGYIAVADSEGKWGYINREGELVIDYQYNDALSFSNGLGAVQRVNDWGYVSTHNVLVIEENLTSATPFHNGIAQVSFADGISLISLKYFED